MFKIEFLTKRLPSFRNKILNFLLVFNSYLFFGFAILYVVYSIVNMQILSIDNIIPFFKIELDNIFEPISTINLLFFFFLFFIFRMMRNKQKEIKTIGTISFFLFYTIALITGHADRVLSSSNLFFIGLTKFFFDYIAQIVFLFSMIFLTALIFDKNKIKSLLGFIVVIFIFFILIINDTQSFDFLYKVLYYTFGTFIPYLHLRFLYDEYIKK